MDPGSCVFCEIVAGRAPASIVFEGERVLAFMDLRQPHPGHVLVIPKEHIADIHGLDDPTGAEMMRVLVRVARAVDAALKPDGINITQSSGEAAGQEVFHLHFHVLPRMAGDRLLTMQGHLEPTPERAELDAVAAEIRSELPRSDVRPS